MITVCAVNSTPATTQVAPNVAGVEFTALSNHVTGRTGLGLRHEGFLICHSRSLRDRQQLCWSEDPVP